ncbi:hypothetical protein T484DRAFT_1936034 [Baffinella frigidus]|nr:hypothetical protein T484DRAFT_1936034 [Cryptophyta sp. CCMP2293]
MRGMVRDSDPGEEQQWDRQMLSLQLQPPSDAAPCRHPLARLAFARKYLNPHTSAPTCRTSFRPLIFETSRFSPS